MLRTGALSERHQYTHICTLERRISGHAYTESLLIVECAAGRRYGALTARRVGSIISHLRVMLTTTVSRYGT